MRSRSTHSAIGCRHPALRSDQRGLSSLDYTILFIAILVGAIATWSAVGEDMYRELTNGQSEVSNTLARAANVANGQGANVQDNGTRTITPSNGTRAATSSGGPSAADLGGPAAMPGTPSQPPALDRANAPTGHAPSAPANANAARAQNVANAAPAGTTQRAARPAATPPAASAVRASTMPTSSTRADPAVSSNGAALRQAGPAPSQTPAPDVGILDQKLDTGGKVAVVAGGAVLGAGLAAGTGVATAYGASLLCGPAAPACAGAVTVGLAAAGVYTLVNGGWDELTGSFGRVFSNEQATVGDALTVGSTIGTVIYGASEAAIGLSRGAAASSAAADASEIATATNATSAAAEASEAASAARATTAITEASEASSATRATAASSTTETSEAAAAAAGVAREEAEQAAVSPVVENGGLTAHENAGGHVLRKHVGQTTEQLAQRLSNEAHVPRASTFNSRAEAEAVISEAMHSNQAQIDAWVANGAPKKLTLKAPVAGGSVLERGATTTVPGRGALVVLKGNGHGGWYILTGYPTP